MGMTPHELAAALRREIIVGTHPPGKRLVEDRLAKQYGVSRIPVREALRLLAGEGFLGMRPNAGVFVESLNERDGADLLEIRGALEPLAAARASTRRSEEQLAALNDVLEKGFVAVEMGDLSVLPDLNTTFHRLLIEAGGNKTLGQIVSQLQDKIAWVYAVELPRRAGDSWVEHRLILRAIEDADEDAARALMVAHIRSATNAYRLRLGPVE